MEREGEGELLMSSLQASQPSAAIAPNTNATNINATPKNKCRRDDVAQRLITVSSRTQVTTCQGGSSPDGGMVCRVKGWLRCKLRAPVTGCIAHQARKHLLFIRHGGVGKPVRHCPLSAQPILSCDLAPTHMSPKYRPRLMQRAIKRLRNGCPAPNLFRWRELPVEHQLGTPALPADG